MTLEQFRIELLNQSRALAQAETGFTDQAFASLAGDRLVAAEELGICEPCHVRHNGPRNVRLKLDGFEWDEDDDSLRLLLAKFEGGTDPQVVTKTIAESEFKAVRAFVENAVSGWCRQNLEPASEGFRLAEEIRHQAEAGNISRIRIFLVTDGLLSERVKDWPEGSVAGIPVDYRIWDISRFFDVERSALGREAIEVDFTVHPGGGVPVLVVESGSKDYEGYLCHINGKTLADIYDRYGSRLLEGNVRAFLSARGKVNKGIQATIAKQPEMFFAFNNGIAATASSLELGESRSGEAVVLRATNLQIVNGGQTTASLAFARRKSNASLDAISVAMKVSVVTEIKASEITPLISRFANSQNKVSDADLWSNHQFHRRIEELSRRLLAPASGGRQYQTRWYYERARGQYQSDLGRCRTAAERGTFERQNPKAQLVSKELLAKVENAWLLQPHVVCMGGQKNFLRFAQRAVADWESDNTQFSETYFRRMVGKLLLLRAAEEVTVAANSENRSIKAHVANYTVSSIACVLANSGRDAHWDLFWREQGIPEDWRDLIREVVEQIVPIMTKTDSEAMILTEWFKKEVLWDRIRRHLRSIQIPSATRTISQSESRAEARDGKRDQEISSSLDEVATVLAIKTEGWSELEAWFAIPSNRRVGPQEIKLIEKFAARADVPSEAEARRLMKALRVATSSGFVPKSDGIRSAIGSSHT